MAPSYPTIVASNIWEDLKRATQGAWVRKSEVEKRIELPGGGSVTVRSADNPDSLRGSGLDGVVVDEAAFCMAEAWYLSIRPALSDKQGWALLGTTPNGRNWLYDVFRRAGSNPDWARWQLPSDYNPLVTAEEMAALKEELGPRKFAQEHLAQFTEVEGALWPGDYFDDHIWASEHEWPDRFELSVMATDPSLGKNDRSDYSAIVFLGLSRGRMWVDSNIQRRPPLSIVEDNYGMFRRYDPMYVGIETVGFQEVLQPLCDLWMEQHNLPPLPIAKINNAGKASKEMRIQRLDPYLANRQFRFRDTPYNRILVEQLMMHPLKGYYDDGPDALEMAVRLLRWAGQRQPQDEEVLSA